MSTQPFHVTDSNFEETIKNNSLVLIDFSMLSCYACMDQFNHFSDYVKSLKQKADLTGILVIEEPGSLSITYLKKMLKGFILGNGIEYPIFIDQSGEFKNLKKQGDVLVFTEDEKVVKLCKFRDFSGEVTHE